MKVDDTSTSVFALEVASFESGYEVDDNEAAKIIIATALSEIPGIGFALGALVEIFWPASHKDVWPEIKDRVEALVNQKISDRVWGQTTESLRGLRNVLSDYLDAAANDKKDPGYVGQVWTTSQAFFRHDLPSFQADGFQLLLLPLFAQFANLHLLLLRDGARFGAAWGWSPELVDRTAKTLQKTIGDYSSYTDQIYQGGLAQVVSSAKPSSHKTEPFNTVNRFQREMQLTVLDHQLSWPYLDLQKYPEPVEVPVTRQIYSQAVGTSDDNPFAPPANPSKPISNIIVWGWDRIDAMQVDYPSGGGPGGITSTGRMGNRQGGSDQQPYGGHFDIARTGPVVAVRTKAGDIVNAMWLTFQNGATSNQLGGHYPGGGESVFRYPGHILSSIKVMGESRFRGYRSADCAVFGFKYPNERFPRPTARVVRAFFVGDPARASAREVAKRIGLSAEGGAAVERWSESYAWNDLRKASQAERAKLVARLPA